MNALLYVVGPRDHTLVLTSRVEVGDLLLVRGRDLVVRHVSGTGPCTVLTDLPTGVLLPAGEPVRVWRELVG